MSQELARSYSALWTEADRQFQRHRGTCSTCAWDPRRRRPTVLCVTGQALFDESERLMALAADQIITSEERKS